MAEPDRVRTWAEALIVLHLDPSWRFGFDSAKTRAGQCNYTDRRITVSRHLTGRFSDDEIHQVLLHEVAHAIAGPNAGHGTEWKRIAAGLGYEGKRLHGGTIADDLARWVGTCPSGHTHYRYRRPTAAFACGKCSRTFDPAFAITWVERSAVERSTAVRPTS